MTIIEENTNIEPEPEVEMAKDVLEIITVFLGKFFILFTV